MHKASSALMCLFVMGCVSQSDVTEIRRSQETIKKNQKKILEKLDAVAKRSGKPQRKPQAKPDPKLTYAFPAGSSAAKGPRDAWVTLVEISEFQ